MTVGPGMRVFAARAFLRQEAAELMGALLTGNDERVRRVVQQSFARSGSLLYVMSHLVDTARQELEDMWYRGDLGMVDEHRKLAQLEDVVGEIAAEVPRPMPAARTCLLISTDPVSGAINRAILEEDGWMVRMLAVKDAIQRAVNMPLSDRRLVVMVGTAAAAGRELRSLVARLKAQGSHVLVAVPDEWALVGGWHQLGADERAGNAQTLVLTAKKLYSAHTSFSISEVAAALRVTPHAIRAWERRYALPIPSRDRTGQRRYTAEDVQLLLRVSHGVTVHRRSLKLAALEAQGFVADEMPDVGAVTGVPAIERAGPVGQPWLRVADAMPEMLMLIDASGTIVDCNVATARARNRLRENIRGARLVDLIVEYDRAKAIRLYRPSPRRRDGWELRMRTDDDNFTVVSFDSRVVIGRGGRLLGLIGRTITPSKSAA